MRLPIAPRHPLAPITEQRAEARELSKEEEAPANEAETKEDVARVA